jgi:ParB/RepB/Spo0J family partition protein
MEDTNLDVANDVVVLKTDSDLLSIVNNVNKTKRNDVYHVDPRMITIDAGHNVRDFETDRVKEHIEMLAANIAVNGVLTPLECRREHIGKNPNNGEPVYKYVIIDGECRFRAVTSLDGTDKAVSRVPVILERTGNNEADRISDMLNANESLRFAPIELGTAYKKFLRIGLTEEEIAQRLGKSLNHVKNCLELLEYDVNVIEAVKVNKITANNVRQLDKKVKDEGFLDDYTRKKEVSNRLEKAIMLAEEEGDTGKSGRLNVTKYLDIKQTAEERLINAISLVTDTLNKWNFTREQLHDLLEDLRSGQSMQNAINHIFGTSLLEDEEKAVSNVE